MIFYLILYIYIHMSDTYLETDTKDSGQVESSLELLNYVTNLSRSHYIMLHLSIKTLLKPFIVDKYIRFLLFYTYS